MAVLLALQCRKYAGQNADAPDSPKADAGKSNRLRGDDARADILSSKPNAPGTITIHPTETGRFSADCATLTGFICAPGAETPESALAGLYALLNELGADYLRECGVALDFYNKDG